MRIIGNVKADVADAAPIQPPQLPAVPHAAPMLLGTDPLRD